jgi:integrase
VEIKGKFRGFEVIDQNRKHLEPHELKAFFAQVAPDPFWGPFFAIQYYYGARVSEPALLLREDINFRDSLILIRRLKKRNTDTGYGEYVYGLPDSLKREIRRAVSHSRTHGLLANPWLFPSPRKSTKAPLERLGQIRRLDSGYCAISRMSAHKAFAQAAKAAGIPEGLQHSHTLRHTRATLMLAQGKKPEHVQFLLGHNSINTTMRYLGVAQSMRMRYTVESELGDGFEEVSEQLIRKARRRTAELSVSPHAVEEAEFSATHAPGLPDAVWEGSDE